MDLIYASDVSSSAVIDQQVFQWNGRNEDGNVAGTGVYIYVIEYAGQQVVGKFALVRK